MNEEIVKVYTKYDVIPNRLSVSYIKPFQGEFDDNWNELLSYNFVDHRLYDAVRIEEGVDGVKYVSYTFAE